MILGPRREEIEDWNKQINNYERRKRTKRPFGREKPQMEVNLKSKLNDGSLKFNPILNDFKDQRQHSKTIQQEQISKMKEQIKYMKNNYRYNVDYDIINFNPSLAPKSKRSHSFIEETRKKQYKDPTYQDFNIINNQGLQTKYLDKRDLRHQKKYERKIHNKNSRVYNIINGGFNQNLGDNSRIQDYSLGQSSLKGSQVLSDYDPVFGKYSTPQQQQKFKSIQLQRSRRQRKDFQQKLPPSYRYKQSVQINPQVAVPPVVQELDKRQELSKERYKQKHRIEEQLKIRNQYEDYKKQELTKNRVHNGRMLQLQNRQFNILNSHNYDSSRTEKLYGKPVDQGGYDIRPHVRELSHFKQSGFNTIKK